MKHRVYIPDGLFQWIEDAKCGCDDRNSEIAENNHHTDRHHPHCQPQHKTQTTVTLSAAAACKDKGQ